MIETIFQSPGEQADIWLNEDAFVRARNDPDIHSALGQPAPAKIFFQRAEQRLALGAEQGDFALVRPGYMLHQYVQMDLPEPEFMRRKLGQIDDLFKINIRHAIPVGMQFARQFASPGTTFAQHKFTTVLRFPLAEILQPIIKIDGELDVK